MTSPAGTDRDDPVAGRSASTWSWLLPVLTFLLGCLLGGVVIGAGTSGAGGGAGGETVTSGTTAAPDGSDGDGAAEGEGEGEDGAGEEPASEDTVVRVPESCLAAADGAVVASNRIDDVVAAVRDLDARRLQEVVDEVQQQQPQVRELAERCRSTAGERLEDAELTTAEPSASPSS